MACSALMPGAAVTRATRQWWRGFVPSFVATVAAGLLLTGTPQSILQTFRAGTSNSTPMPISGHLQGPPHTAAKPQGWLSGVSSRLSPLKNDLDAIFGMLMGDKLQMVPKDKALPGRGTPMRVTNEHYVLKTPIQPPFPQEMETVVFGTGCFWGTEKMFWKVPGVYSTAVGYAAGHTPNPTYEEVCSGKTGHNEVVLVVYDPKRVSFVDLLRNFWESHDPTQGMGQGNDRGTQYRSGIYPTNEVQQRLAEASLEAYKTTIAAQGYPKITTEIVPNVEFYYAEDYHQQYLAKPFSRPYCSAQPSGISLPAYAQWAPTGLESQAPKLPDAYWEKYGPKPGCTIKGPNTQNEW